MSCLKYKLLTPEYVIILSSSTFFFYFNYVPEDLLCEIAILTDDTALNKTHPVTKNLTCYDKLKQPLNGNLIFQIKIFGKYFHFSSATFDFEVSRFDT